MREKSEGIKARNLGGGNKVVWNKNPGGKGAGERTGEESESHGTWRGRM